MYFSILASVSGSGKQMWIGLENPNAVQCSGATCLGQMVWVDGSTLVNIDSLYEAVNINASEPFLESVL